MTKNYRERLKIEHVKNAMNSLAKRGLKDTADNILLEIAVLFNNSVGGSKTTVLKLREILRVSSSTIQLTGHERLDQLVDGWVTARMGVYQERIEELEVKNGLLLSELEKLKGCADDLVCRSNQLESENQLLHVQLKGLKKGIELSIDDSGGVGTDDDPNGWRNEFEADRDRKVAEALEFFGKNMVDVEEVEFYVSKVKGDQDLVPLWESEGINNPIIRKMFGAFIARKHLDKEHHDFKTWCRVRGV